MKVEFELLEKKFTTEDNREIKYYVLKRTLVDNTTLEIPIKGDKSKLLINIILSPVFNAKSYYNRICVSARPMRGV